MKASTKVIKASGELGHRTVTVALQFGHGSHHADLRACCGEVPTARWAFKLELHGHQISLPRNLFLTVWSQSVGVKIHGSAGSLIEEMCC
jgi:hypothetical protein